MKQKRKLLLSKVIKPSRNADKKVRFIAVISNNK